MRMHQLQYEQGYRPVQTAETLRFGTLMHGALEVWWRDGQNLDAALATMRDADPFDHATARALMTGYHHRWKAEEFEVLAVEREFETELVNPETGASSRTWRLAGKMDAIVRDRAGRVLIVEHKTTSEPIGAGSEYWQRLKLDGQISTYYTGARSLGYDVAGCLYDVIGKPGIRPLKATPPDARKYTKSGELYAKQRLNDETPEEYEARVLEDIASDPDGYFQRGQVVRLEAEMDDAMFDLVQLGRTIHEYRRAGRAPRNVDACKQYGRSCAYLPVCTGEASLEDPTRYRRLNDPHPELSQEAA